MFSERRWGMPLFSAAMVLCACACAQAATPQEDAFLKVWGAHVRAPNDHKAVIEACQSVMDKSSTLGEFLPVVKTLAAWHLLAGGMQADAVRIFESAMTGDKAARPVARFADIMARRWLTRMDIEKVRQALQIIYRQEVAYPQNLTVLSRLPQAPPAYDRWGRPWQYELSTYKKIQGLSGQRYHLHSRNLDDEARLAEALARPYGARITLKPVAAAAQSSAPVQFITTANPTPIWLSEGAAYDHLSFAYSGLKLVILTDGDHWLVAPKP